MPSSSQRAKTETQKYSGTTASCEAEFAASAVSDTAVADFSFSGVHTIASSVCSVSVVFTLVCVVVCVTRAREEVP